MTQRLEALLDELQRRATMVAGEFTSALQDAIKAGESIGARIEGSRTGETFLHELAKVAPNRADLMLEATAVEPNTSINIPNAYGETAADQLAARGGFETLRELVDADRPLQIDSPMNNPSGHETAYRIAMREAPMGVVEAMHDYAARAADRGQELGRIYYNRVGRFGDSVLHNLAGRPDLSASDVDDYANTINFKLGATPDEIRQLGELKNANGQTFFNELVGRNPSLALDVHRSLAMNSLSDSPTASSFNLEGLLRGDPHTPQTGRNLTLADDTVPALQLAKSQNEGAERLMAEIVKWVDAEDLHVRTVAGDTPLSIMAGKGWVDALDAALKAGVDPNYGAGELTKNPLQEAMKNNARPDLGYAAVKKLIRKSLDSRWLNDPNPDAPSIVKYGVDHADHLLVGRAVLLGGDPNGHPAANYSPLRAAIEKFENDPDSYGAILRRLVFSGASLKRVDADMMSPGARLEHPEMAGARDYVHRLAVISKMADQYGMGFAAAAVDGFRHKNQPDQSPAVAIGTLQLMPGFSRSFADKILSNEEAAKFADSALKEALLLHVEKDPNTRAMDIADHSRTLLSVPASNREQMLTEIEKVRSALVSLGPDQITPDAIDGYQRQIMAANRLHRWVSDSLDIVDSPDAASALSAEHARYLDRSFFDFSEAIAASPLALDPQASEFPLRLGREGVWEAEVSVAGNSHAAPKSGVPITMLYGQTDDGFPAPQVTPAPDDGSLMTYMASVESAVSDRGVTTGIVSFNNPTVVYTDNAMVEQFTVDAESLKSMGFDGAVIYDSTEGRVAGAIDLGGRRMEMPNAATVIGVNNSQSSALDLSVDNSPEPEAAPARGLGF